MTHVRRAGSGDARSIGQLLYEFNLELGVPTPSADFLGTRFAELAARDDVELLLVGEDPVGFAFLTFRPTPYAEGPLAQLEDLFVRKVERGRGLGSALMAAAIEAARERGSHEIHASVDEVDVAARRFYRNHEFLTVLPGTDYRVFNYQRKV